MENMEKIKKIRAAIEQKPVRSAWSRGVKVYAGELLDGLTAAMLFGDCAALREQLLNGARDWSEYSYGGSALVYDGDIAARLCCPSEYRKSRGGERNPNCRETWLDVQARALRQAAKMIFIVARELERAERSGEAA